MRKKLIALFTVVFVAMGIYLLTAANINNYLAPQLHQDVFTYTKNATTNDTSGWYSLGGANVIELTDYYSGSASSTFTTYVIGKFSGGAEKLVYTGSARTSAAVTHINLRNADSSLIGAVEQVKIAHKIINGAADSTNLLKAYTNVLCR
jgi:hypothetical protein